MNKYDSTHSRSSHSQVASGTLQDHIDKVKGQLEFESFDTPYIPQAEEICLIIAEMAMLPPSATVQIGGNKLTAEAVRVIYDRLGHDDIISVMDNFEAAEYNIRFKKTYLRTALYNEVFERTSRAINNIRTYIPEYSTTRKNMIVERKA